MKSITILDQDYKSETNLLYMKNFYLLYKNYVKDKSQSVNQIASNEIAQQLVEQFDSEITQQVAEQLANDLFSIPWGHHTLLIDKCSQDPQKALCKSKDKVKAQYALESSSQPIGISEYDLEKFYPEKVEGTIPTIAEIEDAMNKEDDSTINKKSF